MQFQIQATCADANVFTSSANGAGILEQKKMQEIPVQCS